MSTSIFQHHPNTIFIIFTPLHHQPKPVPASARHTGQPESYYHGEGRVALTGDKPAFQYKLTDHLGNTMVLFEDKDGDGIITTESNPAENEVLQRNFYYAFGLPMQGPWNHTPTDPDMPYLYNGKELEGELGLGWYAYGFRYYDASVGRFVGVDPLAGELQQWSVYAYAINIPNRYIDYQGLYPIEIMVRSFAPFNHFGPGKQWAGDGSSRSFTYSTEATSRLAMRTNYNTQTHMATSTAWGAMSKSKYGAFAYSDAYLNGGQRSVETSGNNLDLHLFGKLEAIFPPIPGSHESPGGRFTPTSDIDIHSRLTINSTDGVLEITGLISGDGFPSAEAFVTDDFGTSIFLGTYSTSGGQQTGPVKELVGDRGLPMIHVNLRISVGENGAFNGVYTTDDLGNESIMSPSDYNAIFQSRSTTNR
jgi:RHS repeat-associated protein